MRRWVQVAFLGLFALLFALNPLAETLLLPPDLFLKADPLLALSAFLASWRFHESLLYGLPVLLMALVAGRFFCGWLCPLGTLFDLCAGKSSAKKLLCFAAVEAVPAGAACCCSPAGPQPCRPC